MPQADLTLRPARMADARLLLEWRNDSATRLNSRKNAPITLDEHRAWLSRVLQSSDHLVRIAEASSTPVGVVRGLRIPEGWELSWTVAPGARGRGFGGQMLQHFTMGLSGRLVAMIRKGNFASAKIAANAGLRLVAGSSNPDFELWVRE
jgi:UDP-2,4-diacetamido-2,4,6-trideoxy-beta-L-altropyranose hydrolase